MLIKVYVIYAVNFGGNANNGVPAGLVSSNVNNDPTNTNTNVGGRLCYHNYYKKKT